MKEDRASRPCATYYLAHELGDYTVECGALVSEAFLAGAESAEVLSGARHNVGAKCHLNAANRIAVGGHVEENNGVRHNCKECKVFVGSSKQGGNVGLGKFRKSLDGMCDPSFSI